MRDTLDFTILETSSGSYGITRRYVGGWRVYFATGFDAVVVGDYSTEADAIDAAAEHQVNLWMGV